ncbi:MAG: N-acetyl-beta-hexosaminidase [Chthonomonadaceae bacterium]|nr:N-acetyl-beta-hexosaminidase [Chthonomonadaceae bacterium]
MGPAIGRTQAAPQAPDASAPLRIGRWTARYLRNGLYLDFDQVPLVRGGLVQVFSQGYTKGYYGSSSSNARPTTETLPDGGRAYTTLFTYESAPQKFTATQRIEVHPNNTVMFALRYRWDGPEPALLEWNTARLWAYPLVGATYRAEHAAGTSPTNDHVGALPRGSKYPADSLAPLWQSLTFQETTFGPLSLRVGAGEPADGVLFDGRDDEYLRDEKLFWLGLLGTEMTPGQEATRSFTLTLHAPRTLVPVAPVSASQEQRPAKIVRIPDAARPLPPLLDAQNHPVLIPEPKIVRFPAGETEDFPVTSRLVLSDQLPATAEFAPVREEMARFAVDTNRETGVKANVQPGAVTGPSIAVRVEALATLPAEGYQLSVTPEEIRIIGRDAAGAFYGLQTLRQLLQRRAKGRFAFAGVSISDWPSLAFRGIHIFSGKEALPFHQRLIERVLSRYKLNRMVIECEYAHWRTHPEIWVPYGMNLDELRDEVGFARDHFMEPIPLVNSLGHSEWIFANHQHQDLAEDVNSQHAYDASNPDSYKFIFDIFGEALDVFHPKLFHIGHDEVKVPSQDREFGKYPARPDNIQKGASALFIEDTNRLADWLRGRGVHTILWGDMLLHESEEPTLPGVPVMTAANAPSVAEAIRRRDAMPTNAVIADWRYTPGDEQRNGLALFRQRGEQTLGCAWFQPENIRGWALQAIAHNSLGTLQTTWAGYDSNAGMLEGWYDYRQFLAYVLAAEYAWSGTTRHPYDLFGKPFYRGYEPPKPEAILNPYTPTASHATSDALSYNAMTVFNRAYRETQATDKPLPGWYLSLRDAANIRLNENWPEALPITAYVPTRDVHSADAKDWPIEEREAPQIADVGIRTLGIRPGGVMLHGLLNRDQPGENPPGSPGVVYPNAVLLPVHARAQWLCFLHATAYAAEDSAPVGAYVLHYADGRTAAIPLHYGREIRALDDDTSAATLSTDPVHWGKAAAPLSLRLLRWKNPRPTVEIVSLEFRAEHPYAAPILFGVTGR